MSLRYYIAKRIVFCFALIIAVIVFDYVLFVAMGNPTESFLPGGSKAGITQKTFEEYLKGIIHRWGLDQPWHVRIFTAIVNMLTFNFGKSYNSGMPISQELGYRLPFTLLLLGSSTTAAIIIGVILGVITASRRGGIFDSFNVTSSLIFNSLPVFWIGLVLILIFSWKLGWLPAYHSWPESWNLSGFPKAFGVSSSVSTMSANIALNLNPSGILELISGYLRHLALPFITLTIFTYGGYLLLTRAVMIDALTEDYIVTARAKGVPERSVIYKHALKNASLPLITTIALSYGGIVSGAVITESTFSYCGVGRWLFEAIIGYDYGVLVPAFFIISLCVIAANFIADLLYGVIDPRIKY
jgi:peptide/nickel transport system permease protein